MDMEYFVWALRDSWWIIALGIIIMVAYYCWMRWGFEGMFVGAMTALILVNWFWVTGMFSSYGHTVRIGAYIYSEQEYKEQVYEWCKLVDDSHGKWVSMVSLPQISDNGTEYIWVEFAYQEGKSWYEPIWVGHQGLTF